MTHRGPFQPLLFCDMRLGLRSRLQRPQPNPRGSTQTCSLSAAAAPGQFLLAAVMRRSQLLSGCCHHTRSSHRQDDRQLNLLQKPSAPCLVVVCGQDLSTQATSEGFTPLPATSTRGAGENLPALQKHAGPSQSRRTDCSGGV